MDESADTVPSDSSPYVVADARWIDEVGGCHVRIEPDSFPAWEYSIRNLNGTPGEFDMSTFRMMRHGGPHASDVTHHQTLFAAVGAVTVVSGHIEAEMKRILLVAADGSKTSFADVDLTWTDLEKGLEAVAADPDLKFATRLHDVLEWGKSKKIKKRRHDVVHSAWTLYNIGHYEANRFARKTSGSMIVYSHEDIADLVTSMFEYLRWLQNIVRWPTAVLPPLPDGVTAPLMTMTLVKAT